MSWDQLIGIYRDGAEPDDDDSGVCPECGQPLTSNAQGGQACTFDGWPNN